MHPLLSQATILNVIVGTHSTCRGAGRTECAVHTHEVEPLSYDSVQDAIVNAEDDQDSSLTAKAAVHQDGQEEAAVPQEVRTLVSISINRKIMTAEIVNIMGGYNIKFYDAWTYFNGENFYYASDWKHEIIDESGPVVKAKWIKQKENYLLETSPRECYPLLRNFLYLTISNKRGKLQYFGEKQILNEEFDCEEMEKILNESGENLAIVAIELVNRITEALGISEDIANEI